jgi:putative tryptophan/tyrosine transport system substrate-binding protein
MKRRQFITLLGGAATAWPYKALAQTSRKRALIGFLAPGSKAAGGRFNNGFPQGMRELGYLEGRDYVFEERYADSDLSRLPLLAEQLVQLKPDVIVAGTVLAALPLKQATASIPIVGINLTEPVAMGLVVTEAQPATNVTGTLQRVEGMSGKQLEIALDLVPGATKIGVLANINNPYNLVQRREAEAAAAKSGVGLVPVEVRAAEELGPAFQTFARERATIVLVLSDVMFVAMRRQIAAFALASRLPTVYNFREHVEDGGLISYGIDLHASYRRGAYYVDRILKGEKPANLPVEFPTKLELVINLATAKAIGIAVPPTLLARADEVIE